MNAEIPHSGFSPQRALNRCVTRTLGDLRRSIKRNRTISLPTLLRLFSRRWEEMCRSQIQPRIEQQQLERAGLDTVRTYYRRHQPFK
jgi:hypothetical protein